MDDYNENLEKNNANFVPLTPITFLERTKDIYPNYESIIYKKRVYTWKKTYDRCARFASALEKHGVKLGDTVSICFRWLRFRRACRRRPNPWDEVH